MQKLKAKVHFIDTNGTLYVATENGLGLAFHDIVPGSYLEEDELILELKPNLGDTPKGGFKRSADYFIKEVVHVLR